MIESSTTNRSVLRSVFRFPALPEVLHLHGQVITAPTTVLPVRKEGPLKSSAITSSLVIGVLGVATAFPILGQQAQQKPGSLMISQEDTVKAGAREQYEGGRKQLAAWHASVKDPHSLVVFQVRTGESVGNYVLVRRGLKWADLDKELVPGAQHQAEVDKALGDSKIKSVAKMYEEVPELGHETGASSDRPAKYYEIDTFHVPLSKIRLFVAAATRFREALEKSKIPMDASWYSLEEGGESGTWIMVVSHNTWASFDDPAVKSPPEILVDAFGRNEGQAVVEQIENAMGGFFTSEVVEFRPDLSYFPAK
jgi:hypothetical protein